MNRFKIFLISLFSLIGYSNLVAQTYDQDANEVDFYVPGILANDAMQQVNFLLCFIENTNFQAFVDSGVYKALIDEAQCQTADGADASADQAAATGSSASTAGAGATGNQVDATNYTPGVFQNVTEGNTISGKGWVSLSFEFGEGAPPTPVTAYVRTVLSEDASASNRFGTFVMRYDLRNDIQINLGGGANMPANSEIEKGYLDVDNTSIKYRMEGFESPPRALDADLADLNNIQGILQSTVQVSASGNLTTYSVKHQINVNEGANRYCQKFLSANQWSQVGTTWTEGNAITEANLAAAISGADYVDTDGGIGETTTGQHCWDLRKSKAKRVIYEYGTYNASDNTRLSLSTPSMSLEANTVDNSSLNSPIWAFASYWGVHVDHNKRGDVTNSIQFRNQRDKNDGAIYNLRKNYYEITKKERQYLSLNQMGGVSFQMYVGWQKNDTTWRPKMGNLNFPLSGSCNAAQGNCEEYSGTISVSGNTVTFNVTHGIDWSAADPHFELTNPFSFTAANWHTQMTNGSGWTLNMDFWDPDAHQSYSIPYAAFNAVASTTPASQVRTRIESKISLADLEADIANGGAGATGLMCISRCLDVTNMNTSLAAAFTALGNSAPTSNSLTTPFKDIGPWFKVDTFYDTNNNGNVDGGEQLYPAGSYNNIGGIKDNEAATYTVITESGVKKLRDVGRSASLEYSNANDTSLTARKHGDGLGNYRFKEKVSSYTVDNYEQNFGWAFNMQVVIDSNANKAALLCETESGEYRGYNARFKAQSNGAAQHSNVASGRTYYCESRLWEGAVATTYSISVKQMPDYRLYNDTTSQFVNVSAPETAVLTVDANNVVYNFPNTNLAGKKYKLKFEGFGNLHNFPGRVVNTCTGLVVGRYVKNWNQCYRYVHEFTIKDGTVLAHTNSSRPDIKVRALRGDEYLLKLNPTPSGISYTKVPSDLPQSSLLQTLFGTGTNGIGTVPTVTIPSNGSNEAAVVHGVTVHSP